MPFTEFDVESEIKRQCAADPEFKRIHEEHKKHGTRYDTDEIEELMREFPDNPLLKNFDLDEEATERLLKAMEEPARAVEYKKNNRLQEGRELLAKLSTQYNNK